LGEEYELYDGTKCSPKVNSTSSAMGLVDGDAFIGTNNVEDCEGILVLAKENGEVHLLELKDFDVADGTLDIKDRTTGKDYNDKNSPVDLGFKSDFTFAFVGNELQLIEIEDGSDIESELGAKIDIIQVNGQVRIFISDSEGFGTQIFDFQPNGDEDDIEISTPQNVNLNPIKEDSDTEIGIDNVNWGTVYEYDSDKKDELSIIYPEEQVIANVYVMKADTKITKTPKTKWNTERLEAARLASEIGDYKAHDMIVIGGPCANPIATKLLSNQTRCTDGFEEGKAIIKLFDTGMGKKVLLVAGMTALDTRRASKVLADFEKYNLYGNEILVEGTSLEDISVTVVV